MTKRVLFIAPEKMRDDMTALNGFLNGQDIELQFEARSKTPRSDGRGFDVVISARPIADIANCRHLVRPDADLGKYWQYRTFLNNGIPTPGTWMFSFGMQLDEPGSSLVVLKPDTLDTEFPDAILLMHRQDLPMLSIAGFPPEHPILKFPYVVQDFIATGRFATSFRVILFLGTPILCYRFVGKTELKAVKENSIVTGPELISNGRFGYTVSLCDAADLVDLAIKAASALGNTVLCTVDILREGNKQFVLEVNMDGANIWPLRRGHLLRHIGRDNMIGQFGMLERVSRRIAEIVDDLGDPVSGQNMSGVKVQRNAL
jgi:hypothetical protein